MGKHQSLYLTDDQRLHLQRLERADSTPMEVYRRARILRLCDQTNAPTPTYAEIAQAVGCHKNTVKNVRRRCLLGGLEAALYDSPLPPRTDKRKVTGEVEAHLIALACSSPPEGSARWTLRLLAERVVELGYVPSLSHTTVGEVLKQTKSNPGASNAGVLASRPRST
jgi:hypothetical protein